MTHPWTGLAPHLHDTESGCVAWFIEPVGYLLGMVGRHVVDDAYARFLEGPVFESTLMRRRDPDERILMVADWSTMTGYDTTARKRLTAWAAANRKSIQKMVAVVPPQNKLVSMGLAVARTGLAVAGVDLEVYYDVGTMRRKVWFEIDAG